MKIAYLILAHTDPRQLQKLVKSLFQENVTYFFIHIDKKTNITPFIDKLKDIDNCIFIKNRVTINWAGYSICQAEKNLLKASLGYEKKIERFILLSGLDYPLWSNQRMMTEYINNPHKIYMKAYNLSKVTYPPKIPQRICTYHFRDLQITNRTLRRYIIGGLMHIMNFLPIKKAKYIIHNKEKWDIWGGSQWFNIPRDCAEYINNVSDFKEIIDYFKTSFAPDELMFQTIIYNSPFKKNAESFEENGVYPGLEKTTLTHYIEYRGAQKVFDENDFNKLIASRKMFFRKAVSGKSNQLIKMIDNHRSNERC